MQIKSEYSTVRDSMRGWKTGTQMTPKTKSAVKNKEGKKIVAVLQMSCTAVPDQLSQDRGWRGVLNLMQRAH